MPEPCNCGADDCTRCHPKYGNGFERHECNYCGQPRTVDVYDVGGEDVHCCTHDDCQDQLEEERKMVQDGREISKGFGGGLW